jgi:hypothetical protein
MASDHPFNKTQLRAGDTMLYFSRDAVDWAIAIKTWTKLAHVEIYVGNGMSVASRNGVGVGLYPVRWPGLAVVRRSKVSPNLVAAQRWFNLTANGQKYDWLGLLCFTLAVKQGAPDRMFCSEFWTRWMRHAGVEPFNPTWDADRTPPSFCYVSGALETIWQDGDLF